MAASEIKVATTVFVGNISEKATDTLIRQILLVSRNWLLYIICTNSYTLLVCMLHAQNTILSCMIDLKVCSTLNRNKLWIVLLVWCALNRIICIYCGWRCSLSKESKGGIFLLRCSQFYYALLLRYFLLLLNSQRCGVINAWKRVQGASGKMQGKLCKYYVNIWN